MDLCDVERAPGACRVLFTARGSQPSHRAELRSPRSRPCRLAAVADALNALAYKRNNNNDEEVELVVVQRRIEPPSEAGFGSDELVRIKSSAGGAFKSLSVYRAARIRRRWRRGFDETTGKQIGDGLEIVTTYRVLDGVAGTEMPTSTTKSRIRMVEM